ncbi:hypothetical protein FEP39_03618 [Burkholderia multivorans]|nr:hypothetical protein [Burkholderia multivorans]MDR9058764.1 hypothetical protein [Burkholderia multivorans]MDR9062413.1 hypothetical protein [Burkholderia multivorans]MDR9070388.1 hypothetical protein [Burkholderia multivorans]MDR9076564.1 hypothetical protein [Burkholderia multivorans]
MQAIDSYLKTGHAINILLTDVKKENWATGGKLWSEPR